MLCRRLQSIFATQHPKLLGLTMALALLSASCASQRATSTEGYEIANRVVSDVSEETGEEIVGYSSSTTNQTTKPGLDEAPSDLVIKQPEAEDSEGKGSGLDAPEVKGIVLLENECERTVTTDEYGFEQEDLVCPDANNDAQEPATTTAVPQTVDGSQTTSASSSNSEVSNEEATSTTVAAITVQDIVAHTGMLPVAYYPTLAATAPTESLRTAFARIGDRLDRVERFCGTDSTGWLAELSRLSDDAIAVAELVKQQRTYVGSAEATSLARSFTERSLMESGCSNPSSPIGSITPTAAMPVTSKASAAFVSLNQALRNSEYGPLFHQYSTLPNYLWLRNDTSTIDAVFIGNSQVAAALGVKALNEQMATEFGSVHLPGGLAEVQTWWIPEVTKEVDPKIVIWFVGPLDLFVDCLDKGQTDEYLNFGAARAKAFARNGWLSNVDPIDLILGQRTPDDTVQGDHPKRPGFDPEGIVGQRDYYHPRFSTREFCEQRARVIGDEAKRLEAEGRKVIIIGMPVNPELATKRPGGADGFAEDIEDFTSRHLDGIEFIDLTTSMQQSGSWADLTHLHDDGSSDFTKMVIAELQRVGLS